MASGAITPASSASDSTRVAIKRMRSRDGSEPSLTRTYVMTPRYASNIESKISARSGASASPTGGGTRATIAAQQLLHACAGLRRDPQDVLGIAVEQVGELLRPLVGLRGGQVDLVERGHDDQAGVARQVEVRQRLRLDALRRIDEQDGALARLQRRETSYVKST